MIERSIRYGFLALIAALLMSCGGSGGSSDDDDDPSNGGDDGGSSITPGITLIADTTNLPSNVVTATEGVQLTALVRDQNNNVVSGEDVSFSANSGALQINSSTTDESGAASASLHTGGNKQNRIITVTASVGSDSDSITVEVTGTQLSISGPSALALGGTGTYTVSLTDAADNAIPGEPVTITSSQGNTLSASNLDTDSGGQVQVQLNADNAGTDTLTASALGLTNQTTVEIGGADFQFSSPTSGTQVPLNTPQSVILTWLDDGSPVSGQTVNFSSSRGTLSASSATTNASGEATVSVEASNAGPATITATEAGGLSTQLSLQFIATTPDSVDVQADPATVTPSSQSEIKAVVRDANDNLVTGATVDFSLVDVSNGSLRDGTVTTDTRGIAGTVYTAGSSSAAQPAEITATVRGTGISDTVEVTIGGQALRIVLGTGNEIESPTSSTYRLPYVAIVTDASGNPVPEADFRLSVLSLAYQEGEKVPTDIDGDGTPDKHAPLYQVGGSSAQFGTGCLNEDVNRNGILDAGEDVNSNGRLEPGNVATVPTTVELDENGTGEFGVTYPQNFSQWVKVRLRAVASVQGTETTSDTIFVLPVAADDVNDLNVAPPGEQSPYGLDGDCTTTFDPDTGEET